MSKRALIIGSQTSGLSGVNNDVKAIDELISALGFETNVCVEEKAKRQEILDGYEQLIADSQTGDAAFIFYSGHGGLAANPDYQALTEAGQLAPRYYQFIVPFDIDESTENDFRGITSLELSLLMARLTEKTKNVTLMLDCCHAARMSRGRDLMPKALPKPWFIGVKAHLKKLSDQGISVDDLDIESNPDAVRLVAVGVNDSAYEYTNAAGKRTGLLTESFLLAMEEAQGLQVSWHNLGTRVRERVLMMVPFQRPEIEGPTDRILFQTETVDRTGVLQVIYHADEPILQGGRLMGINVGDQYTILPMGEEKATVENTIADATVAEVSGAVSLLDVKYSPGHTAIPAGANAFPASTVLPKLAVSVSAPDVEDQQLRTAIEASERLRVAAAEEQDSLLAQVVVTDGEIDLRDRSGRFALIEPKPFNEDSVQATVENLNQYARAQVLLNLDSGEGANALQTPYELEFGRVVDGKTQAIDETDNVISVGDRVYLKITNTGTSKIYFSVFDVGLSAKISLLTRAEPSGVELLPNHDYVLGYREGSGLKGLKMGWAASVPDDGPRQESFVAIVSDVPQDLRPLEGRGMRAFGEQLSPLQQMVDQIGLGGTRDVMEDEETPDVRYAVERIDFLLSPTPAPARDLDTFLIDERPQQSLIYLAPRGLEEPPSQVAIRLKELIVHSNRALFSTEIRVDNMIVTGPTNSEEVDSLYKVETARFPKISDGDRVPLDNLLVYHGPVSHFIDMAVWVSRDQKDSLTLAEMIKAEMNSTDFKVAAAAILALSVAAPQAALVVGAVGGAATLIQIGTRLLLQAAGKSIGLYRTSHLAFEQFGVGRHPVQGVMRAQDYSFSYEILPLD